MPSIVDDLQRERRQRYARLTPAELMALSERLGEEALAEFMSANRVDRASALRAIRATRRLGRRASRCFDAAR